MCLSLVSFLSRSAYNNLFSKISNCYLWDILIYLKKKTCNITWQQYSFPAARNVKSKIKVEGKRSNGEMIISEL